MFPHETSVICAMVRLIIDTVYLRLLISATVALFVFLVSTSFFENAVFLAVSFSMTEIASMTSTNSASDLLKFFASLVFTCALLLRLSHSGCSSLRRIDFALLAGLLHFCKHSSRLRCSASACISICLLVQAGKMISLISH